MGGATRPGAAGPLHPVGTHGRAQRRRAAPGPADARDGAGRASAAGARRRPLFTGRAALLCALVLLLALTLAGPVRQYLAGRAELVRLAAEGRELDQRVEDLQAQLERQADPVYVERQARERLTYVLPGDRLIVVVDGEAVEGDAGTLAEATTADEPLPWYEGLMERSRGRRRPREPQE